MIPNSVTIMFFFVWVCHLVFLSGQLAHGAPNKIAAKKSTLNKTRSSKTTQGLGQVAKKPIGGGINHSPMIPMNGKGSSSTLSRRAPASDPNAPIEVRGQSRNLNMLLILQNQNEAIDFIKMRKDYKKETQGMSY